MEEATMAVKKTRKVAGVPVRKGEKMTLGKGWKLVHDGANGERAFVATLKSTVNLGDVRLAIFSVPK
jgi:hypothetical protein